MPGDYWAATGYQAEPQRAKPYPAGYWLSGYLHDRKDKITSSNGDGNNNTATTTR